MMINLSHLQYWFHVIFFILSIGPANSARVVFLEPTLAGLRAAENELQILPTPNPWSPSEILKRFAGDPAICGWVEGDPSKLL